mmetsp:Transcript_6779/g.11395  ORF Transcript_6779/g.11395 Transcript_6779/m.11395 type:complete len:103 (-) Transcript_6779:429-737(-)
MEHKQFQIQSIYCDIYAMSICYPEGRLDLRPYLKKYLFDSRVKKVSVVNENMLKDSELAHFMGLVALKNNGVDINERDLGKTESDELRIDISKPIRCIGKAY